MTLVAADRAFVAPQSLTNDEIRAKLELLRIENERTERMIADYETFKRDAAEVERQFAVAVAAVPDQAELAGALEDLEGVTAASGMSLTRFTPQGSTGGGAPADQRIATKTTSVWASLNRSSACATSAASVTA